MSEIWKPVTGFEGLYEVSNLGNVRSLDRYCLGRDGRSELHRGRVLAKQLTWNGYCDVILSNRSAGIKRKHRPVHALVAEAFLGPRRAGCDVMHLDGDRTNNHAENLRYGPRAENLHQTYDYGGTAGPGKLKKHEALEVIQRLERGEHPCDLAREFGVNNAAIYHIKNGTAFTWLRKEALNAT